jgi:hypothetical protein
LVSIKYIDEFFNRLKDSEDELNGEDICKFLKLVKESIPFSQNVIDRMLIYYKNNLFAEIKNFNNFNHFGVLLNNILLNIAEKKEFIDISFAIIYIAEKTYYKNKENNFNKIYLCGFLSKNRIFSEKSFWVDLIELKLDSVSEIKLDQEIKKREREFNSLQRESLKNINMNNKSNRERFNSTSDSEESKNKVSSENYNSEDLTNRKSLSLEFGSNNNNDSNNNNSIINLSTDFNLENKSKIKQIKINLIKIKLNKMK